MTTTQAIPWKNLSAYDCALHLISDKAKKTKASTAVRDCIICVKRGAKPKERALREGEHYYHMINNPAISGHERCVDNAKPDDNVVVNTPIPQVVQEKIREVVKENGNGKHPKSSDETPVKPVKAADVSYPILPPDKSITRLEDLYRHLGNLEGYQKGYEAAILAMREERAELLRALPEILRAAKQVCQ